MNEAMLIWLNLQILQPVKGNWISQLSINGSINGLN